MKTTPTDKWAYVPHQGILTHYGITFANLTSDGIRSLTATKAAILVDLLNRPTTRPKPAQPKKRRKTGATRTRTTVSAQITKGAPLVIGLNPQGWHKPVRGVCFRCGEKFHPDLIGKKHAGYKKTGRSRTVKCGGTIEAEDDSPAPACEKCDKRPCQKYGGIGGYSYQCKQCNDAQGVKRRAASKRRRESCGN